MKTVLGKSKAAALEETGYIRFDLSSELEHPGSMEQFRQLLQEFAELPLDPYNKKAHRYRRYSRGIILPWTKEFHWLPNYQTSDGEQLCEYFQGTYNAEYNEEYRAFSPLSEATKQNPLLTKIIMYDYEQTFWDRRTLTMPIHVGVHFVKMLVSDPHAESVASPDHVHQDGEPFTFCHLVERSNVLGGTNLIATPESAGKKREEIKPDHILEEFELNHPLESYGVCDRMVSHYVSGVRLGTDGGVAVRSAILIDYVPTVISIP
ncbi:2OG-Fe dioxygenase family protein [Kroppenstedtia eburnea]|uniref:2OG-Fe dioxygenase n=1 Tax=Kroppenstedtia eburnea TaxID=714067 RepID=A0A1N7LB52_9BACL|nr:2OG-Fe dioxygenase family protein [Kroppenstedtia eburnea]QKI81438.1 2OG-Fe dioxygenase family protein [Kroppenstedtia eburnea]SIS71019.1 hypothetical protein SAMN05421790_10462 [Kroppenstedtia eburnea]